MDKEKSSSYADYFIVDGKHVGDYEGMYQNASDPWRIEELGFRLDMRAALLLLSLIPRAPERVLDLGSGAGLFALELYKALKGINPQVSMTLSDVSPTAIILALDRFGRELSGEKLPQSIVMDLRLLNEGLDKDLDKGSGLKGSQGASQGDMEVDSEDKSNFQASLDSSLPKEGSFDLIVMAQTLWGVMENLHGSFLGIKRLLGSQGFLLISQHFPGENRQSYGREITCPEDLMKLLASMGFGLISSLETNRFSNHHWGALWRKD
jgi:SAM-dependent methyltransferase